jgi:hypothetical protein
MNYWFLSKEVVNIINQSKQKNCTDLFYYFYRENTLFKDKGTLTGMGLPVSRQAGFNLPMTNGAVRERDCFGRSSLAMADWRRKMEIATVVPPSQ